MNTSRTGGRHNPGVPGRLGHAPAQPEAHQPDRKAEQERQPPAPVLQNIRRHHGSEERTGYRSEEESGRVAAGRHCAGQATLARARMLDHEDEGGRALAAERQALHHAQSRQEQGRRHSQGLVAGQDTDEKGRESHRRHRDGERGTPAVAVADAARQEAPQRPHQAADREDAEGGKQLRQRILVREEGLADGDREIAVDREIEPFEDVADGPGADDAALLGKHCWRLVDLCQLPFFSMFQNTGTGLVTTPLSRSERVAVGSVYWPSGTCVP